jgi:hypothetical protein
MAATAEMARGNVEAGSQNIARNRLWHESLKEYKPTAQETLQANSGETVVYQKGSSRTRKYAGIAMEWGGALYGIYNLVTLDLGGALAGGVLWVAGRWVKPKEGQ